MRRLRIRASDIRNDPSCSASSSIWQTKNSFISPQPVLWGFFFNLYFRLWRVKSLSVKRYSFSASDFVVNGYFSESLHWSHTRWSKVSLKIAVQGWSFSENSTSVHYYEKATDSLNTFLRQTLWVEKIAFHELYFLQFAAENRHLYQPPYEKPIRYMFPRSNCLNDEVHKIIPLSIIFWIKTIFIVCILIKILQTQFD